VGAPIFVWFGNVGARSRGGVRPPGEWSREGAVSSVYVKGQSVLFFLPYAPEKWGSVPPLQNWGYAYPPYAHKVMSMLKLLIQAGSQIAAGPHYKLRVLVTCSNTSRVSTVHVLPSQ